MKKNRIRLAVPAALLLAALLGALTLAERHAPGATITSFGAALWYGLTTLTTVGYGDAYPVTVLGRVIGTVFQLLSLGFLALAVGTVLALLRGNLLPRLRLARRRTEDRYLFSRSSEAARALAAGLRAADPSCVTLCAGPADPEFPGLCLDLPPERIARLPRGKGRLYCFCMEDSEAENQRLAGRLAGPDCQVYCMSRDLPCAPEIHCFDPVSCCARLYWQRHPLAGPEEKVVLLGSGPWAEAILEEGLCRNLLDPDQRVSYTVIGDFGDFRRCRPRLDLACDPALGFGDRLTFLDGPWNQDLALLAEADRLIFCDADEARIRRALGDLFRFCPVTGQVHARLSEPLAGVSVFGAPEELFTPELVLHRSLDRLAMALHETYRQKTGGLPGWEALSDFTRRSNLASADHLPRKLEILLGRPAALTAENCQAALDRFRALPPEQRSRLRRIEHLRWTRFHLLNNWVWGPVRDNARRIHPALVAFDDLSPADQAKDDYAWELLSAAAELPEPIE